MEAYMDEDQLMGDDGFAAAQETLKKQQELYQNELDEEEREINLTKQQNLQNHKKNKMGKKKNSPGDE